MLSIDTKIGEFILNMDYPIIEGRARQRDLSYKYLIEYPELFELEKGIPYKEFYYHSRMRNKDIEYRILKKITETREHSEFLVHNSPLTISLNRYPDILPYNDTIVSLINNEYINASFIDSALVSSENMFIATQAPLRSTMSTFWSMMWEHNVELIVMICCINESGMKKCEEYFPEEGSMLCNNFEICLEKTYYITSNLIQRDFSIMHIPTKEYKSLSHLHGSAWPDQDAPEIKDEFTSIDIIIHSIKTKRLMNPNCKIAIHCSAGIGRTGVLLGIFNMVVGLEELIELDIQNNTNNSRVSVFGTARRLREQRWGMISSSKQYKFLYKFMEYWITAYLASQVL
jgi:receptor-type tyrosine-protein phosphatase zeta